MNYNGKPIRWRKVIDIVDKNGKRNYITTEFRMPQKPFYGNVIRPVIKKPVLKRECPLKKCVQPKPKKCRYFDYSEWTGCSKMTECNPDYCETHAKTRAMLKPAYDLFNKVIRKSSSIRSRIRGPQTGLQYSVDGVKHTGYDAARFFDKNDGDDAWSNIQKKKDFLQKQSVKGTQSAFVKPYDPFTSTDKFKRGLEILKAKYFASVVNVEQAENRRSNYSFGLSAHPTIYKTLDSFANNKVNFYREKIAVSLRKFIQHMYRAFVSNDVAAIKKYNNYMKDRLIKLVLRNAVNHRHCNFVVDYKRKTRIEAKGKKFVFRRRAFVKDLNILECYKMFVFNRYSLIYHHRRFGRAWRRICLFKCNGKLSKHQLKHPKVTLIKPMTVRIVRSIPRPIVVR